MTDMTHYQCVIEIERDDVSRWRMLRSVVTDTTDPAGLARNQLRRVAANRRHTLTIDDLHVKILDATRPGFERLVFEGYNDDALETMAATGIARHILGHVPVHVITIAGGFADYLDGTSALQDAPEPAYASLRALWAACPRHTHGRSYTVTLAATDAHLEIVATCAETVLGGGGEFSRAETNGARHVIQQINQLLGEPMYVSPGRQP